MMKSFLVLCALAALAVAEDTYEPTNDNFDVEALVKDAKKLDEYTKCFLHKADCDEIASDFRKDLKEAYEQACARCTQAQKHILKKYLEAIKVKLPEQYEDFKKHYDPEGKYSLPLETAIATA